MYTLHIFDADKRDQLIAMLYNPKERLNLIQHVITKSPNHLKTVLDLMIRLAKDLPYRYATSSMLPI